jgi:hypothetical protein
MKINLNKVYIFILCGIGAIMITIYLYLRFLRPKLPRDIPFDFNIFGLLILIELCVIHLYIIYSLFNEKVTIPLPLVKYIQKKEQTRVGYNLHPEDRNKYSFGAGLKNRGDDIIHDHERKLRLDTLLTNANSKY